jgi:paraquat-inducible protein B
MSKQANTKLIGGFVVGAIVLTVAGILLFGSGKFFSRQMKFVLFFQDSVKGLNIGAPVDFRGVNIGAVKDIKIVLNKKDFSLLIPVLVEIDTDRISTGGKVGEIQKLVETRERKTFLELLINRGLKAQLAMQSLVTGQLGIHLDFYPDKPLRLVGEEPSYTAYTEIPTTESSLSAISKTLENIPIGEIADKLEKTLDGLEKLVNSPDLKATLASLNPTVESAHQLLKNLDSQVKPLAKGANGTMDDAKKMLANASKLAADLDARIPKLASSLEDTLKSAGVTMKGADKAIDGIAGDNSPVRRDLVKALNEFASAARSIRILADYIENNPQAFLMGKGKGK